MKKTICKYVYDSDDAHLMGKYTFSYYGDPEGYEERLYQTEDGKYFHYVNGGAHSIRSKEDIVRMSKDSAEKWIKENVKAY